MLTKLICRAESDRAVALATAQVQNSSLAGGTVNIARDDLWIQGVTFGFVVRH